MTPGQCSGNCSRQERVQAKVQRLKTGPLSAKGAHPYRKACGSRGIKVAAPLLDSPCDSPVTYPGDSKNTRKILKRNFNFIGCKLYRTILLKIKARSYPGKPVILYHATRRHQRCSDNLPFIPLLSPQISYYFCDA